MSKPSVLNAPMAGSIFALAMRVTVFHPFSPAPRIARRTGVAKGWLLAVGLALLLPGAAQAACSVDVPPTDYEQCVGQGPFSVRAVLSDACTWRLWKSSTRSGTYAVVATVDNSDTTATHTLTGATTSESGYYYFEFDRNFFPTCHFFSDVFHVVVHPAGPSAQNSPVSRSVCVGDVATFTATATSSSGSATFFWTKNGVAMSDNVRISGASGSGLSSTLTINNVRASDVADYQCNWGSAVCGTTALSGVAALNLHGPIIVDSQPTDVVACVGTQMSMFCQAYYTNSASRNVITATAYQWQKQAANGTWSDRVGATNEAFFIETLVAGDAANYRCQLTGSACGTVYSDEARITLGAPIIVTQPVSTNGCPGSTVTLSVVAANTQPGTTYRWSKLVNGHFVNPTGTNVLGENSATLTILDLGTNDATSYLCALQNVATFGGCGNITNTAIVNVTVNPAAPVIVADPEAVAVPAGGNARFSVTATGAGLTYEWRRGNNALVTNGTYANGTVISGATTPTLRLANISDADVGNAYRAVVRNDCGADSSSAAALTVNGCPWITASPTNLVLCPGGVATFSLTAIGTPAPTYAWRLNGTNLPGATSNTLVIASVARDDAGVYDCVLANSCGAVTSAPVSLTLTGANITEQPKAWHDCGDANFFARFDLVATGTPPLTYRWRKNGVNLADGVNAAGTTVEGADTPNIRFTGGVNYEQNEGNYSCRITDGTGCVVVSETVAMTIGRVTFLTQPIPQQVCAGATVVFTVSATSPPTTSYRWKKGSTFLANTNGVSGALTATLTLTGVDNADEGNYSCEVASSICGSSNVKATSQAANLKVHVALPSVTTPPQDVVVCSASPAAAVFTVVANEAATYQWRKGLVDIAGATNSSLTIAAPVAADVGSYACVLGNPCFNSVTSAPATLTFVGSDIAIAVSPVPVTVCVGDTTTFSVTATGENLTYRWQKNNANLAPGAVVSGETTPTLVLTGVGTGTAGNFRCIVANDCGQVISSAAALVVRSGRPTFTTQPTSRASMVGASTTFNAVASAGPSYQWRKDGLEIPGAVGSAYTIAVLAAGDAGRFDCVASNPCGSVTSLVAVLTVDSTLMLNQAAFTGGQFGFNVTGPAGLSAVIETSADLRLWTPVETNTLTGGRFEFLAVRETNASPRFYRAVLLR